MGILEKKAESRAETNKVALVAHWFAQQDIPKLSDQQIRDKIKEIGYFIDSRAERIETILHLFAKTNKEGISRPIEIAVKEFGAMVNALNKNGARPIRLALLVENLEAFWALRGLGARVDGTNFMGETLEMQLKKNGQTEMLEVLAKSNAMILNGMLSKRA